MIATPSKDGQAAPASNTPADGAAHVPFAERLLAKFHHLVGKGVQAQKPEPRMMPSAVAGPEIGAGARRRLDEIAVARYSVRLLTAGSVVGACVLLMLIVGTLIASSRPKYMMVARPRLADAVQALQQRTIDVDYQQLCLFHRSVLEGLNSIDTGEDRLRLLLEPMMTSEVWLRKTAERSRLMSSFTKYNVTQSCVVKTVRLLEENTKERRATIYIGGYLALLPLKPAPGVVPKTIPYRARVIVDLSAQTQLNPFPFFMVDLEERFGAAAVAWDRAFDK